MQFQTPDAFWLLLLLPALAWFFFWSLRRKRRAAERLGDVALIERLSLRVSPTRERVKPALIGAAVLFLVTLEVRLRRQRALAAIHELRSLAHVVDMHQLTKHPEGLVRKHDASHFGRRRRRLGCPGDQCRGNRCTSSTRSVLRRPFGYAA